MSLGVADRPLPDQDFARQLAGAAHDLRQPLDALAIYMDLLAADPGLAADLAPRMARAMRSLQGVANGLFDFAALRGDAVEPVWADVDVRVLLADLAAVYEPLAEQKGLQWQLHGIDAVVRSDPVLLRRVLGNLLTNAIRYTGRGGVLLAARRRATCIQLEVWDTGRGIALEDQQKIFEPFFRLNSNAATEGAGLGLAIVTDLAGRLGHPIALRSRPGRGSVFRVLTSTAGHSCEQSAALACGS